MAVPGTEFGLKLMQVVGAQTGVTYLSAATSTGYRDLCLMRELGVSKVELRERFPQLYRERVLEPNIREATKFSQMVRGLGRGRVVVNPAALFVPGWTQPDYMALWEEAIRSYSLEMVLSPGWVMSTGARREAVIALESMLTILDVKGRELTANDLLRQDARAREQLRVEGFDEAMVAEYMPFIDYAAIDVTPGDLAGQSHRLADSAWESNRRVHSDELP